MVAPTRTTRGSRTTMIPTVMWMILVGIVSFLLGRMTRSPTDYSSPTKIRASSSSKIETAKEACDESVTAVAASTAPPQAEVQETQKAITIGTDREEECFQKATAANLEYLKPRIKKLFFGNSDYIETLLTKLGSDPLSQNYNAFVDVGAGSYARVGGDKTLTVLFDQVFSSKGKTIFAFEPFKEAYDRLVIATSAEQAKGDSKFHLLNMGCGATPFPLRFFGSKNVMTANRRINHHPMYTGEIKGEGDAMARYSAGDQGSVNATTVDLLLAEHSLDHLNILKTDTEGLEFEVLLGANKLITAKKIDMLIVAYEDKWTWDSFTAIYPADNGSFVKSSPMEMDTPNLMSVSRWLENKEYATYLLGKGDKGSDGGYTVIPVFGEYWNDEFEIGRDPLSYGLTFTWMDLIAVQQGSDLQAWLERNSRNSEFCPSKES